ncbi:diguanylate cyclase domain-containing protein [Clostridium thermobutyricum]|uniref:GGDEF domain protein n=1 Tax=Clostridium thermobutyricum DSM 4928 TaxID=1121339 RepID=A0A1V4SU31_9CLOT|nr:diguanylate cyclase [Clostridium thermobutyricum]OPX46976.1 GGDEF domain protein [Clostridium thermobutyricum DSM 4928]
MEKLDIRKKIDLIITLMTVFFFALGLTFSMFEFKSSYENYIMFLILMIVCIVSYYLGVTVSLVLTLVVDFAYISVKIYQFFMSGTLANVETYYWLIMIVLAALVSSQLSKNIVELQYEISELKDKNQKLVMIDSEVGIRNMKAFMNEMPIYISMVKRHRTIPLTLMVTRIKYSKNIRKIIGDEEYGKLIKLIGTKTSDMLRDEDRKYILSDDTFAYILITDENGSNIVKNRMKQRINEIVIEESKVLGGVKVEIQVGVCEWKEEINNSIEFLRLAESELDYDV